MNLGTTETLPTDSPSAKKTSFPRESLASPSINYTSKNGIISPISDEERRAIADKTARWLFEIGAISFSGPPYFTLTSGKKSPVYVDCRKIISYPRFAEFVTDSACRLLAHKEFDVIAGGETGGIPFAAWIAARLNKPMIYVRKKPKGFGLGSRIEGVLPTRAAPNRALPAHATPTTDTPSPSTTRSTTTPSTTTPSATTSTTTTSTTSATTSTTTTSTTSATTPSTTTRATPNTPAPSANANYEENERNYEENKGNYEENKGNYEENKGNYEENKGNYEENKGNEGNDFKPRVLLVEDHATDGATKISFIDALRPHTTTKDAFVVFYYDIFATGADALQEKNIFLHALVTWRDAYRLAEKQGDFDIKILEEVAEFLIDPLLWQKVHP